MKTVEFDNLLVQTIGVTSACMQAAAAGRRIIKHSKPSASACCSACWQRIIKHHKPSPASRRGAYKQARNEDRRIR